MIKIKILESTDFDSLGEFEFSLNQVSIGDKKLNNFTIFAPYFLNYKVTLLIKKNSLFISVNKEGPFLVNNIQFIGTKKIKKSDIIILGSTKIKIENYQSEFQNDFSLAEVVKNTKNKLKNEDKAYLKLINEVENQIERIEINNER